MTRATRARIPERVVQRQIVHLLRSLGAQVWVLGTARPRTDGHQGTCQTPGLGDLFAVLRGRALWCEVKARGGKLRPEQVVFRDAVQTTPCHHVVGGVDEVVAWLVGQGVLRADAVAHYRGTSAKADCWQPEARTATRGGGAGIEPSENERRSARPLGRSLGREAKCDA